MGGRGRLRIIEGADIIPFGAFGAISREDTQLLALGKLIIDAVKRLSRDEMYGYLQQCACSRKVRREIDLMNQKSKGVFRFY